MKNWNTPDVTELKVSATADIKPNCEGIGNGTCTDWASGSAGGKRPPCPYNGGYCKRKAVEDGVFDSDEGDIS